MTTDARTAATTLFGLDPASVRCPYPILGALREHEPVAWFDEVDAFVVTSYELITEVLRQPDRFSSRDATGKLTKRQVARMMTELVAEDREVAALVERRAQSDAPLVLVFADPPTHGQQRKLVNRAFGAPAIRALEPEILSLTHSLIDQFVDRGRVEFVRDFAGPLPMAVIARALGVELERMDDFKRWSDGLVGSIGRGQLDKTQLTLIIHSQAQLESYLLSLIEQRDMAPRDDLVSQIVHSRVDGERLTTGETVEMIIQFLVAGNETTTKLIANTMLYLAQDAVLADRVRHDPDLLSPLVEEVLRLEPPSTGLFRTAMVDYELGGRTIPAGSAVWLVYAAGNRDPSQFIHPDEVLVTRDGAAAHLAFGRGAHFCLGAGLARAESRIGIQSVLARCDEIRLAADADDLRYDESYMLRGIQELPLSFSKPDG